MDKNTIDIIACTISVMAFGISIYSLVSNNKTVRIATESKFVDETRSFNDLEIQHPGLRKIYLLQEDSMAALKNDNEGAMLKTYCYKYLNLLDSMNIHYSAAKKYSKRAGWIKKQIKDETYFGNWCNFYSKRFRKGTVGHILMKDIFLNNKTTGEYATKFINMVNYLIDEQQELS